MEGNTHLLEHEATVEWGRSQIVAIRFPALNGPSFLTRNGWTFSLDHELKGVYLNFKLPTQGIRHADWSNYCGLLLAISTEDGVEIWEPWKKKKRVIFPRGTRPATIVRWSPEDHYLAIAARAIIVYDTASELEIARFHSHPAGVTGMCWSRDGTKLASLDERGNLRVHELRSGASRQIRNTRTTISGALAWSPNGQQLAAQDSPEGIGTPTCIQILNSSTFQIEATLPHHSVGCIKFSHDGALLASKSHHQGVRVWRTQDWALVATIDEPSPNYSWFDLEFGAHPKTLLTLGDTGKALRIWRCGSSKNVSSPEECSSSVSAKILKAEDCIEKELTPNGQKLQLWRKRLQTVEAATDSFSKGEALQKLCESLFSSIPDFHIQAKQRTRDEEIDIVIFNHASTAPFSGEGPVILVECKNWSSKCGKDEFVLFRDKMANRFGRCSLGFLISWSGITNTVEIAQLRKSQDRMIVVCLTKAHLNEAVDSGDFVKILHREYREAILL